MEIPRELTIRCGDAERLYDFMIEIGRDPPPGWSQLEGTGIRGDVVGSSSDLRTLRWDGGGSRPACTLISFHQGPRSWGVMALSHDGARLTVRDKNTALLEFEKIARPIAERLGMEIELTSDRFDINRELSEAAAEKLRVFSRSATKGLGGALPVDHERWLDFVLTAHRDGCKLSATMLREWLIEDEGWYFEIADRLAGEYEFGGEILSYSERQTA